MTRRLLNRWFDLVNKASKNLLIAFDANLCVLTQGRMRALFLVDEKALGLSPVILFIFMSEKNICIPFSDDDLKWKKTYNSFF